MRLNAILISSALLTGSFISGCAVVPKEPVVEVQEPIVIAPPKPLCFELADLQRVEIPAETKVVHGITIIENPPYEPLEQRTAQRIITKQAEVYYVRVDAATGNSTEITNLCDKTIQTGPVGPGAGELDGPPVKVE